MPGRIVEIATTGRSLHLEHGFMAVREDGETVGRVPLDDIDAVISAVPGLFWSGNVLAALAARSVPVVFIGANFKPVAHLLPLAAHHNQGEIIDAQAASSLPVKKRLWARLVKAKIEAQAEVLALTGKDSARLARLRSEVKTGDTTNREALAAQHYWPRLMGDGFRRDRGADGANAMLNYGYAILRAATARAAVSAGLCPSLAVHHASGGDALRLADDLMEPFRPTVDITVHDLVAAGESELTNEVKARLAAVLRIDFITDNGHSPLSHVLVRLAQSLAKVYLNEAKNLSLPKPVRPVLDQLQLGRT